MKSSESTIAIVFGGPSFERDVSLDSARTLYDCVRFDFRPERIHLILIDTPEVFYRVPHEWIYANTIDDILLSGKADGVAATPEPMTLKAVADLLAKADIVVPMLHGRYGEDGGFIRDVRETGADIAMVGSGPDVLWTLFDKLEAYKAMAAIGYATPAFIEIQAGDAPSAALLDFVRAEGRVVVKPRRGGSSDGVSVANSVTLPAALEKAGTFDVSILVERFVEGREFSVIVIADGDDSPVALFPTEVRVDDPVNPIYSRLKKYMPGSGATHLTPAPFGNESLDEIRRQAADIFRKLGVCDWARFDGFLRQDGAIVWSDLNAIPGFGQDSLFFQQAALWGFSHRSVARHILRGWCQRHGKQIDYEQDGAARQKTIAVLGGGTTSERQVSRMSWLNVIVKLGYTGRYAIRPVFVTASGDLVEVPVFVALQHTVEEIEALIRQPDLFDAALAMIETRKAACSEPFRSASGAVDFFPPRRIALSDLPAMADFAFIALHGGWGEDGTLQAQLDALGMPYNGSGPSVSQIGMDKHKTAETLNALALRGFRGARNMLSPFRAALMPFLPDTNTLARAIAAGDGLDRLRRHADLAAFEQAVAALADEWRNALRAPQGLVLKPLADGCSSGVFLWKNDPETLCAYLLAALTDQPSVPWAFFGGEYASIPTELRIAMPFKGHDSILVEELHADTDAARVIEMTVAVLGQKGQLKALLPSETRKDFGVLTLEEKFCKGVGTNVTPPTGLSSGAIASICARIEAFANGFGIDGYARIDFMYYVETDDMVLIEVNTLPGLSSATVTFTQALVTPDIHAAPSEFLERIMLAKAPDLNQAVRLSA